MRVLYLVSQYPAPSHTFIEREIIGLREIGVDVETCSVRSTPSSDLLSDTMRRESAGTSVIQTSARSALRDLGVVARRDPGAVARTLRTVLGTGERTARSRLWQVFYFVEAVRVLRQMRRHGLRHVHAHFANNAADIARLVVRLGRAVDGPDAGWRWTFTMHGPVEFEAVERYDLAAKVEEAVGVACISDFARSQLMKLVDPTFWDKLSIVRMSVDVDRFSPASPKSSDDGRVDLLSVGRLVPEKGWPVLIDAVTMARDRGLDVHLTIVGDGPLRSELEDQVSCAGLTERVSFLGAVGQDRLPEIYRAHDAFCLPSFQEGLPVVLMEAMASGLPVLTTPIAGIPELVVHRSTGMLVAPGRPDLLAAAIEEVATDKDLASRLAAAGRVSVLRQHSVTITAPAQLAFLEEASRRRLPARR